MCVYLVRSTTMLSSPFTQTTRSKSLGLPPPSSPISKVSHVRGFVIEAASGDNRPVTLTQDVSVADSRYLCIGCGTSAMLLPIWQGQSRSRQPGLLRCNAHRPARWQRRRKPTRGVASSSVGSSRKLRYEFNQRTKRASTTKAKARPGAAQVTKYHSRLGITTSGRGDKRGGDCAVHQRPRDD